MSLAIRVEVENTLTIIYTEEVYSVDTHKNRQLGVNQYKQSLFYTRDHQATPLEQSGLSIAQVYIYTSSNRPHLPNFSVPLGIKYATLSSQAHLSNPKATINR